MENKNLWLLPTDKPSRLYYWEDKLVLGNLATTPINRNIYITSDEEIKEGDWVKNISFEEPIFKVDAKGFTYVTLLPHLKFKKVVLTTDPDLISDGVQVIDDEFLEWFVKNPSCEKVEIEKVGGKYFNDGTIGVISYDIIIPRKGQQIINEYFVGGYHNTSYANNSIVGGGLIIPKEEPKQETLENKLQSLYFKWQERQNKYEWLAKKFMAINEHNFKKFTYKAMATRDCWKELLELIEDEKKSNL